MATPIPKDIVILGGSYAGLSTAHYLLRHVLKALPANNPHRVVVVSTASEAFDRPACPRAMISDEFFDQSKLFVSIEKQLQQYPQQNWRFIHGTATSLDTTNRSVNVDLAAGGTESLSYHALVIATGATTTSPLLGYTKDERALKDSWNAFRAVLPQAKEIVIAGGGPSAVETAAELGQYLNGRPGWFSKPAPKTNITLITSADKILPVLRNSLADKAEHELSVLGVSVIKNTKVNSISPPESGTTQVAERTTVTLSDGRTMTCDIYIPAYGFSPNTSFIDATHLDTDHRVKTNPSTLRVDSAGPRVYALGDASNFARAACHLIFNAVPILGANIKHDLLEAAGQTPTPLKTHKEDKRETQLVPLGSRAVGSAMGWTLPSFVVWLIKGRDYWLWTTPALWSGKQFSKE